MPWNSLDNKKKILYAIIIALVILLLIMGGWLIYRSRKPAVPAPAPTANQNVPINQPQGQNTINPISLDNAKAVQQQEIPVNLVAAPFAERYGSYNNQDVQANFAELDSLMTAKFKAYVFGTYIPALQKSLPSIDHYFAVNTKALSTRIDSIDDKKGTATVVVSTQRQEIGDNNIPGKVYYQDARVELQKEGAQWKVSGLYWQ